MHHAEIGSDPDKRNYIVSNERLRQAGRTRNAMSVLHRRTRTHGWRLPTSWSGYSQHAVDTLPLPTKYLSARDVLAFRDHAFQRYFSDSGYLSSLERKFGRAAREEVQAMSCHQLRRDLLESRAVS